MKAWTRGASLRLMIGPDKLQASAVWSNSSTGGLGPRVDALDKKAALFESLQMIHDDNGHPASRRASVDRALSSVSLPVDFPNLRSQHISHGHPRYTENRVLSPRDPYPFSIVALWLLHFLAKTSLPARSDPELSATEATPSKSIHVGLVWRKSFLRFELRACK